MSAMASVTQQQDMKRESIHMHLPRIQKPAPFFKGPAIVDGEVKEISLDNYKGKYVILLFYPMDFTFVCPTELIAFSDKIKDFHDINTEVIGVSTDSQFSHFAWVNTPKKEGGVGMLNIPLLADKNMSISRSYGILHQDDGVAFRGIFIIDDKGILRQATINDMPIGRSTEETLRLVRAIQFFEEHGEVCPANWMPGRDTIIPDIEKCKEFFKKN